MRMFRIVWEKLDTVTNMTFHGILHYSREVLFLSTLSFDYQMTGALITQDPVHETKLWSKSGLEPTVISPVAGEDRQQPPFSLPSVFPVPRLL